ncbi:CD209 antigen-like protein E [Mizuhopecten yessoensis]|uniref:CD209 antigen-like protein E n=1 Tax=Mizuhopecten yessoensis TaxID=6573 RepID=UPI000B4595D4|nr:CD209 antigen-like protein E [Mizuhopecten yessoensis]
MAILASETWKSHVVSQSSQMCGDLLFSKVTSSWLECALLCLVQVFCFMFEFSKLTKVCDVFMGIGSTNTIPAVLSVPRLVYKGYTNCERSGYTFVNDGNLCVNEIKGEFTWNDAKAKCETDQGRLLVLTTNAQIRGARKYMRSINKNYVFIGLTDEMKEGHWEWIDGTKLNMSMWSNTLLNNYDANYPAEPGNADCVILGLSSHFDIHCRARHPEWVICERPQLV